MRVRSAASFTLTAVFVVGCGGGDATPPAERPVRPGPIVAQRPPAPSPPQPSAAPASPTTSVSVEPLRAPAASEPGQRCALDGVVQFRTNTPIQNTDGHAIGRFTGVPSHLAVRRLTFGASPRAEIGTGSVLGNFRLHGFVAAKDLPLYTSVDAWVVERHLAIGAHRAVSVTNVSSDKLKIEHVAAPPLAQTFATWTTCSELSLEPGTPPGWSPSGDARGYALRKDTLELFDAPGGSAVGVVKRAAGAPSVLFFGGEQNGGFVHVERRTDVVIDAWAHASDLAALPRGETMDQAEAPVTRSAPHLALATEPRVVKTVREVPLRAETREAAATIGVIGADTDTYVIDVMAGWASVMPRAMDVIPPEGGAFWAKKSDLGL